MPRGGKREGAGRKKGSVTKATQLRQQMIAKIAHEGVSPLDVMLGAMRAAWERNDHEKAAGYARDAAPYIHPRLSTMQHKGDPESPVETVTKIVLVAGRGHGNEH